MYSIIFSWKYCLSPVVIIPWQHKALCLWNDFEICHKYITFLCRGLIYDIVYIEDFHITYKRMTFLLYVFLHVDASDSCDWMIFRILHKYVVSLQYVFFHVDANNSCD